MGKYVHKFNDGLKLLHKKHYQREQYQSFMTGPEWFNVEISANLAGLLKDKKSIFQFPYFSQMAEIWRVFYQSYKASRKYNSAYQILFSEYMVMDLFVVLFTTTELMTKGVISLLLYPFLRQNNDTPMQAHLAEYFAFYAKDIESKPFFMHDYETHLIDLSKKYKQCDKHTWTDWLTWQLVSNELRIKKFISSFLKGSYADEPATTDILVKCRIDDTNEIDAIAAFKKKLNHINPNLGIHIVDNEIFTKEKAANKTYTSVYARLTAPRYMECKEAVYALAHENIHIRHIAGQDHVQVKVDLQAVNEHELSLAQNILSKNEDATPIYSYSDGIHKNRRICLFDVLVKNLDQSLRSLEQQEGSTITFIHNF
ncbi:MAG: hypothetical protein CK426_05635 [Legionella sp.]|nr:MAG: hypothetical protein CK423_06895 [Legionella sp.]PJD98525.1 MAG: hypothetical protein CK426_05635 [Legionella sp.]